MRFTYWSMGKKEVLALLLFVFSFCVERGFSADYYWVGGTGLWSEVDQHWATTSGGTSFHSIVPTSDDNVIFDANSFDATGQVVTLDGNFANAHNIDWSDVTNSPSFESSGGTFTIFGSITYAEDMAVSLASDLIFSGDATGLTLTSAGHQLTSADVTFDNETGAWGLMDSLSVGGTVNFQRGSFTTNGFPASANSFYPRNEFDISIENSTVYLSYYWSISGADVVLNTTNSTIRVGSGVTLGDGYSYNNIVMIGSSTTGSNLTINTLTYESNASISLTNSTVGVLEANGATTNFNRGGNFFQRATISSPTVNYVSPAYYQSHVLDQEYDTLQFTANGVTVSVHPSTQQVNNAFILSGDCESFTTLKSQVSGESVVFNIPFDVDVEYVSVQDIHIEGGASYTLDNSIDLGGNQGWVINELTGVDLYWIGGSSEEWSDGDNWSLTSGGTPYGCPPTIRDNVFFDANSFTVESTVTISSTANANNIDWTGAVFNPTWQAQSGVINIAGSLTLIEDMDVSLNADLHFISCDVGNTITSAGNRVSNRDIHFDCKEGEWTFTDDLNTYGEVFINEGSLIMSDINVNLGALIAYDSTSLDISGSDISLSSGYFGQEITYIWTSWYLGHMVDFESSNSIIRNNASIGQASIRGQAGYTYANISMDNNNDFYCDSCFVDTLFVNASGADIRFSNNSETEIILVEDDDLRLTIDDSYIGTIQVNSENEFSIRGSSSGNNALIDSLLILNPGIQLTLRDTIQVREHLMIPGNCSVFTNIVSSTDGTTAYIDYNQDLTLSYTYIRDIAIGSGANYVATESIDGGGNYGWDISSLSYKTLYWVGGEGDWNDGDNWSLTSGGPPVGCSPSPLDTVIFDENSFDAPNQTVTATTPIAVQTMDWGDVTNQPIFDGDGDQITIGGSLIYAEDMTVDVRSTYTFSSCDTGNTIITGNNRITSSSVGFSCDGGWELQDTLDIGSSIYFSQGSFNSNGNTINVNSFYVTDSLRLDIRNSLINVRSIFEVRDNDVDFLTDSSYIDVDRGRFIGGTGYEYWDVEHSYSSINSYYSLSGNNLTFQNVYLADYSYFGASNSTVGGLHATGSSVSISGGNNVFGVANLNTNISTTIYNQQTFDTLNVNTGGMTLTLQSDRIQTINHEFNIVQTPSFPILLNATTQGTQAHIDFSGIKPPCSEFLFLRDNDISGNAGVPFYAGLDSDDIDNNTGWIFESSADCNTLLCEFEGLTLDLGKDTVFCQFFDLELDPFDVPVHIQWQGITDTPQLEDTLSDYRVTETDTVVVTVSTDICALVDTMILTQEECTVLPLYLCEGDSVLLKSNYPNQNYLWNDGSIVDSLYAKTSGLYWVQVDNGLGDLVDSFQVYVNNYPEIELGNDTTICNGAEYSYEIPTAYNDYEWSVGGNSRTYTTDTASHIWLEVEESGCVTRDSIQISVNTVTLNGLGNDTTICPGASIGWAGTLTGLNYLWENGDSGFENISRVVSDSGLYWLEVSSGQCAERDSIYVTIEDVPVAQFGFEDTTLCNLSSATLSVSDGFDEYLWSNGETDESITFTATGTYWVNVRKGNCVIGDTVSVEMLAVPAFTLGEDTTLCLGDTLEYNIDVGTFTYLWEDGTSGTGIMQRRIASEDTIALTISQEECSRSDTMIVSTSAIAPIGLADSIALCALGTVTLEVLGTYDSYLWNDGNTLNSTEATIAGEYYVETRLEHCVEYDTIQVFEVVLPTISLGDDTTLCAGDSLLYEFSEEGISFEWSDLSTSTGSTSNVINQEGIHWLEWSRLGCSNRDSVEVSIQELADFEFSPVSALCDGDSLVVVVNNIDGDYLWSNGETDTSIVLKTAGEYWLQWENMHCSHADTFEIFVTTPPDFDLGNDTTLCAGDSIFVNLSFVGFDYAWSDGETGADQTSKSLTEAGKYVLEWRSAGCMSADSILIDVTPMPDFEFGVDQSVCLGDSLLLAVPQFSGAYLWSDGETDTSLYAKEAGQYLVVWQDGSCELRDSMDITITNPPSFNLGSDTSLCFADSLIISQSFSGYAFAWSDGETGFDFTDKAISTAGQYWLEVGNGCNHRDTIVVSFKVDQSFSLGDDQTICADTVANLSVTDIYDTYLWSTGETTAAITTDEAGVYTLETEIDDCPYSDTIVVNVTPLPSIELGGDTTMCVNDYTLDVESLYDSYEWNTGGFDASIDIITSGEYSLQVELDGCFNSDTVEITLEGVHTVDLLEDSLILCEGEVIAYTESSGFERYQWSTGDTSSEIEISSGGWLFVEVVQGSCESKDSLFVDELLQAEIDMTDYLEYCNREILSISPVYGNGVFSWEDEYPFVDRVFDQEGTYVAEVSNACFTTTASVFVEEIYCGIVIPPIFTPNGDGVHDEWFFENIDAYPGIQLEIFNRWGSLVYVSGDYQNDWSGRDMITGQDAPDGTYYYIIRHDDVPEKLRNGNVTIIR